MAAYRRAAATLADRFDDLRSLYDQGNQYRVRDKQASARAASRSIKKRCFFEFSGSSCCINVSYWTFTPCATADLKKESTDPAGACPSHSLITACSLIASTLDKGGCNLSCRSTPVTHFTIFGASEGLNLEGASPLLSQETPADANVDTVSIIVRMMVFIGLPRRNNNYTTDETKPLCVRMAAQNKAEQSRISERCNFWLAS
jgi:hypothetical protein